MSTIKGRYILNTTIGCLVTGLKAQRERIMSFRPTVCIIADYYENLNVFSSLQQ